jgi:tRNA nucleotidyltransferase (CCA-adding enzyme)
MPDLSPELVIEALAGRPDGAAVLAAAAPGVAVVGGFTRDTLVGRRPREVDVVVEGDAAAFAKKLGGTLTTHPAFGTAQATRDGWTVDVAAARSERYPAPGALPLVEPAPLRDDLLRRDFTVNAIAVTLVDGGMVAAPHALEDLVAGRLRVLHEASFTDDPTRILRLARYAQRTGFSVEAGTAELASQATLATVSGARIGAELALILRERDPLGVLEGLQAKLPIVVERALVARALALAPADADRDLLILAAVMRDGRAGAEWLESLELGARARDVLVAAPSAASLAADLAAAAQPSSIRSLVQGVPVELVALAGALGAGDAVSRWFGELRHITLQITGDDLLAAGLAQSPEIGARLERTLNLRLDGSLDAGREAELASALGEG